LSRQRKQGGGALPILNLPHKSDSGKQVIFQSHFIFNQFSFTPCNCYSSVARFGVLVGVMFPEQNTLPNTYYRAKQQNKPFQVWEQINKQG